MEKTQERRRYPRNLEQHRLFLIHGSQRFQAETVDLSKAGMLVACPVVPPDLDRGSEAIFELVWSAEPEANAFVRGRITRVIRDSDFDNVLIGVEFSEAIARAPAALRGFLERVIGIEHGAVKIMKDSSGVKSLVFDFEPVHREGNERLRALQSSLFQSFDDLEEADRLLDGFGSVDNLVPQDPGEVAPMVAGQVTPAPPAEQLVDARAPNKKAKAKKKKSAKEKRSRPAGTKSSIFKSLLPSFGKSGTGGDVIPPVPDEVGVANIDGLDVKCEIDGTSFRARATRLYCAGLKCEVDSGLPELYRSVTLIIPRGDGKKITDIILNGDITRVRSNPDSEETGIFEIRLSMRNETGMMVAYRELLEQLSIGEA